MNAWIHGTRWTLWIIISIISISAINSHMNEWWGIMNLFTIDKTKKKKLNQMMNKWNKQNIIIVIMYWWLLALLKRYIFFCFHFIRSINYRLQIQSIFCHHDHHLKLYGKMNLNFFFCSLISTTKTIHTIVFT